MAVLDAHIDAQVDRRILGAPDLLPFEAGTYTQVNGVDPTATRSSTYWAADLNVTGWAAGNDRDYNNGCVLVTRRHAVTAAHLSIFVGDKMWFIDANGITRPATIAAKVELIPTSDFEVLVFDQDVHESISHYSILPADYATYVDIIDRPVLRCRCGPQVPSQQPPGAVVSEIWRLRENLGRWDIDTLNSGLSSANREAHTGTAVAGDSGSPLFLLIDDTPILLKIMEGTFDGIFLTLSSSEINTAITQLDITVGDPTGYTLTEYDLAAAAASIQNSGYHGLLGWLMGWLNVGSPRPTDPGLEFTIPENRMHFTMPENRCHFTARENRTHFTIPKD